MRRPALVCGGLLLALGALSLLEALRVRDEWPGARLMPAVLAGVFAVLGAGHLASAAGDRVMEPPAWPEAPGWWRVGFVFGALALYVAALP
ncbi:MAG TPA: hypothetical protein VFX28_07155, partial [Methylomirabilota bacterium]|nr:hypothetical protein [Methylomirabilota bacterium]